MLHVTTGKIAFVSMTQPHHTVVSLALVMQGMTRIRECRPAGNMVMTIDDGNSIAVVRYSQLCNRCQIYTCCASCRNCSACWCLKEDFAMRTQQSHDEQGGQQGQSKFPGLASQLTCLHHFHQTLLISCSHLLLISWIIPSVMRSFLLA